MFVSAMVCAVSGLAQADGKSAGMESGNLIIKNYGSKDGLKQNISTPMTNNATEMRTVDGSQSFSAALSGPSSSQFLQILIQPGPTGDLATVMVAQDTTASGRFDYTFNVGVPVSGVCANGFISCSPGTWVGCQPYSWSSDLAGRLSIVPVGISSLGGCYCINDSCAVEGSSLAFANSSILLKDLGGGAVGSIHAADATVMITDVKTDLMSITYYGQIIKKSNTAVATMPSLQASASVAQAQSYYSNWGQISNDAGALVMTQAADPNSPYSLLNNASSSYQTATKTCSIIRSGKVATRETSLSSTGFATSCVDNNTYVKIVQPDEHSYTFMFAGTGPSGLDSIGLNCDEKDWIPLITVSPSAPPTDGASQWKLTAATFVADMSGTGCTKGNISLDAIINGTGNAEKTPSSCGNDGAQTLDINWSYLFKYLIESYQEAVNDGCSLLERDSKCRLQAENIDNVVTVRGYNSTGLAPLANCQSFPSQVGENYLVCRPWWSKSRTYVCQTKPYDFESVKKRFISVNSTAKDTGTSLEYTDNRQDLVTGSWSTSSNSFNIPVRDKGSDCEPACKIKRAFVDTQVGVSGVLSNDRTPGGASTFDTIYAACVDNLCPVQAGDAIMQDCTCVNEFGQAATIMQLMRKAGGDEICSSGTPSKPGK